MRIVDIADMAWHVLSIEYIFSRKVELGILLPTYLLAPDIHTYTLCRKEKHWETREREFVQY